MKTSELMIGDYVKYQGHIYIVEEISVKGWVHLIHPETKVRVNMASDYIIDLLEPIPLTPEIFERNGFKLNPQGAYSNGRHTSIGVVRDGRYFANINTETDDPSFLYQCGKYVHEFQHALRICGLNDLADNFKLEE
jgi:hypothetical protein